MESYIINSEPGYTITAQSQHWRVTIEHLDINAGHPDELIDLIRAAFRGQFNESIEKEWFENE